MKKELNYLNFFPTNQIYKSGTEKQVVAVLQNIDFLIRIFLTDVEIFWSNFKVTKPGNQFNPLLRCEDNKWSENLISIILYRDSFVVSYEWGGLKKLHFSLKSTAKAA